MHNIIYKTRSSFVRSEIHFVIISVRKVLRLFKIL